MTRLSKAAALGCCVIGLLWTTPLAAQRRPAANVPATLEIEVLDPGVDALGNPAVLVNPGSGGTVEVDIPPVVLVHRYYYSGDRSFQAQLLPGGPTIVVANNPIDNERCYIPLQMMPGAPRVTYTDKYIDYDYGQHGVKVVFKAHGPIVRYRSGPTIGKKVANVLHAEQWRERHEQATGYNRMAFNNTQSALQGLYVDGAKLVESATLPVKQAVRALPFGAALTDPDRARLRAEKIAAYKREQELRKLRKQRALEEASLPTVR